MYEVVKVYMLLHENDLVLGLGHNGDSFNFLSFVFHSSSYLYTYEMKRQIVFVIM